MARRGRIATSRATRSRAQPIRPRPGLCSRHHRLYRRNGYLPVVETIEERVLTMEQSALDSFLSRKQRSSKKIQDCARKETDPFFKRIIGPIRQEVCGRLVHLDTPCLTLTLVPISRTSWTMCDGCDALVNSLRDVLTSVFEVSNLLEQQRQGRGSRGSWPPGPRYWPYPPQSPGFTA